MSDRELLTIWREECERAPALVDLAAGKDKSGNFKSKGLRFDEAALVRIGSAIESASFIHDATERYVICKRMRRLARAAGVESAMPDDDTLYACIGTMLGTIAGAIERSAQRAPAEPVRLLAPRPAPARDVVPGKVHCAKCGFTLQRVNLYMLSGATGPGGEETEPCPNDGTPLLPVTWEQEAREAMRMAEQQFDRAHALEAAGAELVACKDLKDEESRLRQRRDVAISRNRDATARVDAMREDYNRRKPLAWAAMRLALKGPHHG